jgi:hypothetical protein
MSPITVRIRTTGIGSNRLGVRLFPDGPDVSYPETEAWLR